MASSQQIRDWWATYLCDPDKYVTVAFPGDNRVWNLKVAAASAPAWQDFAQIMAEHDYLFLSSAGGTYNCRKISGSDKYSLHAYAVALDLNPNSNPYGSPLRHNYPAAFIADVEAHRSNGVQTFQWGGRWNTPDAMHWQINCEPTDIDGNYQPPLGDDENVEDVVKGIQRSLEAAGYDPGVIDGQWGPNTEAAHSEMTNDASSGTGGGGLERGDTVKLV